MAIKKTNKTRKNGDGAGKGTRRDENRFEALNLETSEDTNREQGAVLKISNREKHEANQRGLVRS